MCGTNLNTINEKIDAQEARAGRLDPPRAAAGGFRDGSRTLAFLRQAFPWGNTNLPFFPAAAGSRAEPVLPISLPSRQSLASAVVCRCGCRNRVTASNGVRLAKLSGGRTHIWMEPDGNPSAPSAQRRGQHLQQARQLRSISCRISTRSGNPCANETVTPHAREQTKYLPDVRSI
jgi:hypothetical protein